MEVRDIEKGFIVLDPKNPRSVIPDEDINSLLDSIESEGQQEPILVEELGRNEYLVTEGNKRVTAIQKSKKVKTVKAIIEHKLTPEERLLKQIIIDTHRQNWNMTDRDKAWKRLWDMGKYTPDTFAKKLSTTKGIVESFIDRQSLGSDFIQKIPNVTAYNITETQYIKDKDKRKKVLVYAHKTELTRKDIRQLSQVAEKVSDKVLKEVFEDKISIADAKNMVGLKVEDQERALITTKGLNQHKKNLKKLLKDGSITEDVKKVRMISDLVNEFQMEFFSTSSAIRKLSSKLQYMKDQDFEKYANHQMVKILESCLDELESAVIPATTQIRQSIKGIKVKRLEAK